MPQLEGLYMLTPENEIVPVPDKDPEVELNPEDGTANEGDNGDAE